jgi:DNA-binding response OmpR family regulator
MGKLIYFVDDDKMILNLLEYTFSSRDGYVVKTFRSGEDFMASFHNNPDLVVLDHSFLLSNTIYESGIDILKKIRETNSYVPVVILSGEKNEAVISEYKNLRITKFIIKDSFFIDSLIESIKVILTQVKPTCSEV